MHLDTTRPFTRIEALRAGLTDRQLNGPRYRRLLQGAYVSAHVAEHPDLRARAALMLCGTDAVLSHSSTARLVGAPVPDDGVEHVTVPSAGERRRRTDLISHVAALQAEEIRVLRGLRVTAPSRLFLDMAAQLDLVDLVVLGDWLVAQEHISIAQLQLYLANATGRHVRAARRAAELVRAGVDSPMETRLRLLIVFAGLPEPVVNLRIRDEDGNVVLKLDLSWPDYHLAVEYDGRHHVERIEQWERDHARRDELENDGWRLMVVTAKGIYREPEVTLDRIHRALRERGASVGPLKGTWRRHFR